MTRHALPAHAIIISAVALGAATLAHELTLLGRAPLYPHVALTPMAQMAVMMLGAGLLAAVRNMAIRKRHGAPESDWALPAFTAVTRLGPARTIGVVLATQILSLAAGESLEQHAAGLSLTGLTALFGTTLITAPLIHVAAGVAAGALLWLGARAMCRHADAVARIVHAVVQWLSREEALAPRVAYRVGTVMVPAPHHRPVAYFLANRPPPISVSFE